MLAKILFLLYFLCLLAQASEEQYNKMNAFIEENGREITLSLCHYVTKSEYGLEQTASYSQSLKDSGYILYQGFIGNFHPAKFHHLDKNEIPLVSWESLAGSYLCAGPGALSRFCRSDGHLLSEIGQ